MTKKGKVDGARQPKKGKQGQKTRDEPPRNPRAIELERHIAEQHLTIDRAKDDLSEAKKTLTELLKEYKDVDPWQQTLMPPAEEE